MEGTNLHIINGTVVKKPEYKAVGENKQVANFSVACNRTYKKDGQKTQDVQYINIECWGNLASLAEKHFDRGTNLHIRGEVRTDKWQAEDGTNRYKTKTLAQIITFLPSGAKEMTTVSADEAAEQVETLKNEAPQSQPQANAAPVNEQAFNGDDDDEDLPF